MGRRPHSQERPKPLDRGVPIPAADGHRRVSLYSLQVDREGEAAETFGDKVTDLAPFLTDFADTAAAMRNLDLIVPVDTSVVHLAGALGQPVWTLLPCMPDWRWLLEREDSPWYPTARLFRQGSPDDWEGVVARMARALGELMP